MLQVAHWPEIEQGVPSIENRMKKIADKIKMTHLALVETKTVGNSNLRDRERNGAGCKLRQRIPREAARSFHDTDRTLAPRPREPIERG
jgi:hypothetical protein